MSTTSQGYAALDEVAQRGAATIRETKAVFGEVTSDAQRKGREARDSVLNAILDWSRSAPTRRSQSPA